MPIAIPTTAAAGKQKSWHGLVVPQVQRRIRHDPALGVGVVQPRRAAKGGARVLVQQEDQRQRALGGGQPGHQFAPGRRGVFGLERVAERLIEGRMLAEPDGMAEGRPEARRRAVGAVPNNMAAAP